MGFRSMRRNGFRLMCSIGFRLLCRPSATSAVFGMCSGSIVHSTVRPHVDERSTGKSRGLETLKKRASFECKPNWAQNIYLICCECVIHLQPFFRHILQNHQSFPHALTRQFRNNFSKLRSFSLKHSCLVTYFLILLYKSILYHSMCSISCTGRPSTSRSTSPTNTTYSTPALDSSLRTTHRLYWSTPSIQPMDSL